MEVFDVNVLRSITTVVSLALFIGILAWAWSAQRKEDFDQAEKLPFEQD
jgi:cytochrome c oxidase cbb3-type subunit 4